MTKDKHPIINIKDFNNISKAGLFEMGPKFSYKMFQILNDLDSKEQQEYEDKCKANLDFYFGAQQTQEEADAIEDRGQYSIIINKVRKLMKSLVGLLTANKPQFSAYPAHLEDDDLYVSNMSNLIFDWVWNNSKGTQTHRKVVQRGIRDNIGYYKVESTVDNKIRFIGLSYDDIRVQKNSRDSLFDDASVIDYHKWISIDYAKTFYGINVDLFDTPPKSWGNYQDDMGRRPEVGKMYSADKNYVEIHELRRRIPVRDNKDKLTYKIIKDSVIGLGHIYREVLPDPISYYDIIPVYSDDTENPWKLGELEFLKGLQRFYNKAYGVIIHNAQLMSNPKVFVFQNSIPNGNVKKFEDHFSQPGSINVLQRTSFDGKAEVPIVVAGQPINTAFYTLKQDIDREFEEATIPKVMLGMGDTTNQRRNLSRLDMLENVLDSYKVLTGNIDESLSRLGTVCMQFFKAYVKGDRVLDITNSRNRINRIRINQKRQLDINDPRSIAEYKRVQTERGVHPIDIDNTIDEAREDNDKLKALEYVLNSTEDMTTDIRVVPKSYAPTYELSKLSLMMELKQLGVVDNEAVIEKIPYEDRKKLLKRLSQIEMLKGQNLQLEETVKELQKTIDKFKTMFTNQEIEMIKKDAQLDQAYITKDMRVKAYLQKVFTKMRTNQILNEAELRAKEMIMELRKQLEAENNQEDNEEITIDQLLLS